MFAAYVENPQQPKLLTKHLIDAIKSTVPLSRTMERHISDLRNWAATRTRNASSLPKIQKEMPILLTRQEFEMERSFELIDNKEKNNK